LAEEPKITSVSRVKKPKLITNETQTRNPIDINDLVDFSYAGYDYGSDIPNLTCDVNIDLSHKICNVEDEYCPDITFDLQSAIDDYPGQTICLSSGLYRIDGKINIDSDNTVLRGHSEGTYLYFKSPNLSDLDYTQHFGGDCSKYDDMENMCNSIINCEHRVNECVSIGLTNSGIDISTSQDTSESTFSIVKEEELHSNTINVATIKMGDDELKCGDEILIQVQMTQEFIDEYGMSDNQGFNQVWELNKEHTMFRRRITKPPEPFPIPPIIEDEETRRTEENPPKKLKPRYYKLTLDIPIRHKIDLKYSPFVRKRLNPYLKNVGLEDLFVSNTIPYDYSQKKFKPYTKENFLSAGEIINVDNVKNGWIKNINSFSPTPIGPQANDAPSIIQYLYGVDYETEVGGMKITEVPMKSNITNIFCSMVKAKFAGNYDNYWSEKVCDVAHNASIWTELYISSVQEGSEIDHENGEGVEGEQYLFFSNPGEDCKQMKKRVLNDNYGDMDLDMAFDMFPTFNQQNHMSGHPPELVTFGPVGDGDSRPFSEIRALDEKKAIIIFKGDNIIDWFEEYNIPENTDLTTINLRLRFQNERYPNSTGDWHNCGWNEYGGFSCKTYQIEKWFYLQQQDYGEIHFKNDFIDYPDGFDFQDDLAGEVYPTLLHSQFYRTQFDFVNNPYIPETFYIDDVGMPNDDDMKNFMQFQISVGGITDCSGVCHPKELIPLQPMIGVNAVQFCDGSNNFDASCCICDEARQMYDYFIDGTRAFPINYCDSPLWLGGAEDTEEGDVIYSRPVWMDYFFQTYHSTETPMNYFTFESEDFGDYDIEYGGVSVDEPTDDHSVIKAFDDFMNEIGNPTNIPSIKEEPKHLLSSGISLNNSRNMTIKDCTLKLPQNKAGGGRGYLFNVSDGNNDILIQDCEGYRGRHNFLSSGKFSNSGIVHDRVKSSGGWLWLNETGNVDEDPTKWYQYTDDEWWSRYQELEAVGLGKPGFSDNHVGLTFGSLYTDSELHGGLAWHNRGNLSNGAGQTTVNSTLWNIKGHDEIPDNNWLNMSIPGMGLIQSFNFGDGLIYQPHYETNSNFIYDTETEVDEEVTTYINYLEGMVNPYGYDFETGFGTTYGLFSMLGERFVEILMRSFRAGGFTITDGLPGGDLVDFVEIYYIKFRDDITLSSNFDEEENELRIDIGGAMIIRGRGQAILPVPGFDIPIARNFTAYTNYFDCDIRVNFNTNSVSTAISSGYVISDVDFDGGWFPGREFLDQYVENELNRKVTFDYLGDEIRNYLTTDTLPAQLKYYTFGGNEEIYLELINPNIKEASGLAQSRQFDNVFWTHNDSIPSGETPNVIYAFNQDGEDLGKLIISPTINQRDWEDMAYDGTHLYIGEIGDNNKNYDLYYVYKCVELNPNGNDLTTECEDFPFTYDDNESYDAETLMVDSNGDIYIITKDSTSKIFLLDTETGVANYVMDISFDDDNINDLNLITGGDINGDGSRMIIRTYANIYIYEKSGNGIGAIQNAIAGGYTIGEYSREPFEQGEAVAISDGGYYTLSEESNPISTKLKELKDFFSKGGDFVFGDRRTGTEPSDELRILTDVELAEDNYQSSLYNKQLDERLSLPISEDITIPQCGGQEEEQEEEELEPDLIPGCRDINACNYKSWATTDDDSCLYPGDFPHRCYEDLDGDIGYESPIMIYWCDDKTYLNTNPKKCEDCQTATVDCFKKTISGIEETSDDYRSPGNQGLIYGCTDYTACNYDDGATADDGSCYYGPMNDGYNEEGYNCADVYFVKEFMSVNDNTIRYLGQDVDFTFEASGGNNGFASGPNGELGDGYCGVANFCAKFENGNLKTFRFPNGALNGFIPESIGFATELEQLDLSNNAFDVDGTGSDFYVAGTFVADLPDSIGNLTNLTRLKVGGNRYGELYSRGIPESIGNLRNLEHLDMQAIGNYKLEGTIPESMRNLRNLEQVRLQRNSLEGEIPDIFYGMSNLNVLELSYNNLEGFLPNSICEINPQEMGIFYLAHNKLCAPPPPDCITEDDIHFHTQEYNEDCYTLLQ